MNKFLDAFDSDIKPSMKPSMKMMGSKDCSAFISMLFKAKEDAHISHIEQRSKSDAVHNALGEFYTTLDGLVDTLAEAVMGVHGPLTLSFSATAIADPLSYMQSLYNQVLKERDMYSEGWIQNEIDEIAKLIAHTMYKLKYVTSSAG